ncbi:signal peptidase I [Flocculibacter collagenilyticus]|uniref:signal peptidase I n=1 Tax=Flocculibacter collagenilyticus TaxID=2744479 RepID=UPI0018F424A0|nr:signal peptidase I [Flocculibacter collagenilyticus]
MSKIKDFFKANWGFLLIIFSFVCVRSAIADWYMVPSASMYPTIEIGDRVFVEKNAYSLRVPLTNIRLSEHATPEQGDIVVFESEAADTRMIKRVIGVPGDIVTMRNNQIIINGKALQYDKVSEGTDYQTLVEQLPKKTHHIQTMTNTGVQFSSFGSVTVPEDQYLVLGDNRDRSSDSRVYGFVPKNEIVGKATKVIVSLDYDNYYLPRKNRFFVDI